MSGPGSAWLIAAAALSGLAAISHVAVVLGGPAWYRAFGAGEGMARLAASGSVYPAVITLGIACVLGAWALYALAGAGLAPALPFLRAVLVLVTGVYLVRGVAGFVLAAVAPGQNGVAFWLWSSAICLAIGGVHAVGLWKRWPALSG